MVYGLLSLDVARRTRQFGHSTPARGHSLTRLTALAAVGLIASLLVLGACLA